jgi:hypothetical protein
MMSGYSTAFWPMTKNVAFSFRAANMSSSFGVSVACGPSSNVMAMYGWST